MNLNKTYSRVFLAPDADMGQIDNIKDAYHRLLTMPVDSQEACAAWLEAWSETLSAIGEVGAKTYFAMTCDVNNEEIGKEYQRIIEEVVPLSEDLDEKAKKIFLAMPREWVPEEYDVALQNARWDVELFCEANLPLQSEDMKMRQTYQKITGSWETEFDGEMVTPQKLRPFLEKQDRGLRERAWKAIIDMHLADYDRLNDLFDDMLANRKKMAANSGMPDFAAYQFKNLKRLSYNKEDGKAFRNAIRQFVVPAVGRIMDRRRQKMGLDSVRPWDTNCDPEGAQPPKIYEDIDDLKNKVAKVIGSVDPMFADGFWLMDKKGYLDLENRPGKAPGAYMNSFDEERISMIFSNFVGTARDFDTLLHESGHAMHGFLSRDLPYPARSPPLEFAEVASMSLELLAKPYLHYVYDDATRERLHIKKLEDTLIFLPFMCMLDEFQNWVYVNPSGEDRDARGAKWLELGDKYMPYIDYSGLEEERKIGWQYLHVYEVPLYYIEYGIAQVGALQVYLKSLENYDVAVKNYKHALSLGTTVGLAELFEAAGVKFVMKHPEALKDVTDKIMAEIGLP